MPLDALTLSGLRKELSEKLTGAKIDKVQQPASDTLLLSLHGEHGSFKLIMCAAPGVARVNISQDSFENPAQPPMFCMLMRKHLIGSRILEVRQPGFERMLEFRLFTHDELGVESEKKLVVELIGTASNIGLIGEDGRIIDCIRRYGSADCERRSMLPGMIYRYPEQQKKILLTDMTEELFMERLQEADPETPPEKFLMNTIAGISPLVSREIAFRAGGYENLPEAFSAFLEMFRAEELSPCMVLQEGLPYDFSCMNISQYGTAAANESYPDFSSLIESFYSRRFKAEIMRRNSRELLRTAKSARDRMQRKLTGQREEMKKTESRDEQKKKAELITANIYRIKKGDTLLECEDYYLEDCPLIRIELDPLKTPQQNAAALFKQYNKLKSARIYLEKLIEDAEVQLEYLNSVIDEIERAESEKDLAEIRQEMKDTGYIRKTKAEKKQKVKPRKPLRFMSSDGYEILVGRSNAENDELTTRTARRSDLWLHAQKIHGSHVIIRCDDTEAPERTIEEAASIAAWYSQGRDAGRVAVDYTKIRYVRKPAGSMPGKVIYADYKTINAPADEHLVNRLQA